LKKKSDYLDACEWYTSIEEEYVPETLDPARSLLKPDTSVLSSITTLVELYPKLKLFFDDEASLVVTSTTLAVTSDAKFSLEARQSSIIFLLPEFDVSVMSSALCVIIRKFRNGSSAPHTPEGTKEREEIKKGAVKEQFST
jgi:hypothetical protein